jgi:hypothetical protein
MQYSHVIEVGLVGAAERQCIVGAPELQAREQRLAEHIPAERARLAHQGVDNMPVVDPVFVAADESVHDRDTLAAMVQFHDIRM